MSASTNTTRPTRNARARGVAAASALIPAIAPLGVAVGVALGALSVSPIAAWLSAPLMLAGASQVVVFTHIDGGSAVLTAALAAILLNGRFVIYGAALADRFAATQPGWFRLIGPHYIVDQTYAATVHDITEDDSDDDFRRYFMTAGTILMVVWSASVGVGLVLGPVLPPQIPLEFVLPASFVALIAPTVIRTSEFIAVVSGAFAVLLGASPSATLAVAVLAGAAVGLATSRTA